MILVAFAPLSLTGCGSKSHAHDDHDDDHDGHEGGHHKIVVTCPKLEDVTLTQRYVCQIHSQRHIEVQALETGYLEAIPVKEGQAVKQGDILFSVIPILYRSKLDTELAEVKLAELELNFSRGLAEKKVVAPNEVSLYEAKLARASAKAKLAEAELNFATIRAPFDGIMDRLQRQQGSLVKEGEVLTTLSDNKTMWVYFNVPESRYIEYMQASEKEKAGQRVELMLANGSIFQEKGKIGAIEARFNNENGNIAFRADFANPNGLLRHGMTGTILVHRTAPNVLVIPQRAVFDILANRYVYVVDKDNVVHQREIAVQNELDDIFVVSRGLNADDRIVFEGSRQVRDGQKVEYEFRPPEEIIGHQKNHAE